MRVLVACERFGSVRNAFIKKGFDAISCDIEKTESPGPHYEGYLEDIIGNGSEWDFIIAFPPCTYLSSSGLWRNKYTPGRSEKTETALTFVAMILNAMKESRYGGKLENPIGCIGTRITLDHETKLYTVMQLPDSKKAITRPQIIQPHQFGHDASKSTCLWTVGDCPTLAPTEHVHPRIVNGKKRWGNQTDSGQNRLGPSPDRAALRGKTYEGIANAMADQWGNWLLSKSKQ